MEPDTSPLLPPKKASLRPAWIVAQLWMRGSSLAALADDLGVTRQSVSDAILDGRSERIERAVAAALGLLPHVLWPERFDPDDSRRPGPFTRPRPLRGSRIRRNRTTPAETRNDEGQEAA